MVVLIGSLMSNMRDFGDKKFRTTGPVSNALNSGSSSRNEVDACLTRDKVNKFENLELYLSRDRVIRLKFKGENSQLR